MLSGITKYKDLSQRREEQKRGNEVNGFRCVNKDSEDTGICEIEEDVEIVDNYDEEERFEFKFNQMMQEQFEKMLQKRVAIKDKLAMQVLQAEKEEEGAEGASEELLLPKEDNNKKKRKRREEATKERQERQEAKERQEREEGKERELIKRKNLLFISSISS